MSPMKRPATASLSIAARACRSARAPLPTLSRDHLDYHGTMEHYFEAKMRLFDEVVEDGGTAVIWADDQRARAKSSIARVDGA